MTDKLKELRNLICGCLNHCPDPEWVRCRNCRDEFVDALHGVPIRALIEVAEAADDVADGAGCDLADPRMSYESWQLSNGAMDRLRAALKGLEGQADG